MRASLGRAVCAGQTVKMSTMMRVAMRRTATGMSVEIPGSCEPEDWGAGPGQQAGWCPARVRRDRNSDQLPAERP